MAALLCATLAIPQAYAVTAAEKRAEADAIAEEIDSMQTGLNAMRSLHDKASAEYEEAAAKRDEAEQQLAEKTTQMEALQERMSSFAVSMYKDGGAASFLGVLLQTTSFHEFLTSWDRCALISETGSALLEEERAARAEIEETRATYEQQATRAEQQVKIAEAASKQIEATQSDLSAKVAELNQEAKKLEEQEKADGKADGKSKKAKTEELTDEEARKAEQERKAKEAEIEERAKKAAAEAVAAAAAAHAEESASLLMGEGYFTNPCPTATNSSGFGYRDFDKSFHKGLDMAAPQGTPYFAADDGTVLYATNDGGYNGGAGNWVVISHGNGIVTKYMHSLTTLVKPGDQVKRGQNIGLVGQTGQAFGAHLHFQVEVDGVAVNPLNYI